MITELEKKAFSDLTKKFWNPTQGNFAFSKNESVSSPSITTACILAILNYGDVGQNWIIKNKSKLAKYYENDFPWMDAGKHYKNVMAMSFGIIGLNLLGHKNSSIAEEVYSYLREQQNEDGGWNFNSKYSETSHPYFTYWALRAFLSKGVDKKMWDNCIMAAIKYLIRDIPSYRTRTTTYLMIRHISKLVLGNCTNFIDDNMEKTLSNLPNYKIDRFQFADGTWKPEPAVINSAFFRKSIFTIKNLYFLSELDDNLLSDKYSKMLNWINKNYLDPGWPSDAESSPTGVSWTTAYLLLGLTSYKRVLKDYLDR
uniref:hypothetical protein n=1 Tax=Candidatus Electrothrix sp. TaxID=2170559 RepID=UPI004056FC66